MNLSGLGKFLGHGGWISQYLPRFDGAWIQCVKFEANILICNIIDLSWCLCAMLHSLGVVTSLDCLLTL